MKKLITSFVYSLSPIIDWFLKNNNVFILYRTGNAIGDQLCMTAILKELAENKKFKIIIFSTYIELFYNNPYIWKMIKYDTSLNSKVLKFIVDNVNSNRIKQFCYKPINGLTFENFMKQNDVSLIEAHTNHFNIILQNKRVSPSIFLTKSELEAFKNTFKLPRDFAVIQPVGKTTYTQNKEWGFSKYQELIDFTHSKITWLQVGFTSDELLKNVIDYRGKTNSIRELAYVIKESMFTLTNEGLINHLAASVNTKSFVIFTGFSSQNIANYNTTIPITFKTDLECAPCWFLQKCPKEKMYCTEDISVKQVLEEIGYTQQNFNKE